jgi:hypothetical protein
MTTTKVSPIEGKPSRFIFVNSARAAPDLALCGLGLAYCPDFGVRTSVEHGHLQHVMPDVPTPSTATAATVPPKPCSRLSCVIITVSVCNSEIVKRVISPFLTTLLLQRGSSALRFLHELHRHQRSPGKSVPVVHMYGCGQFPPLHRFRGDRQTCGRRAP